MKYEPDPSKVVRIETLTICGIPIRVDATLCDREELWLTGPDGYAVRVWPPTEDFTLDFSTPQT